MEHAWVEPDDAPDLSSGEWAARLDATAVRCGRPCAASRKVSMTFRLDPEVMARFRAQGAGWQTKNNNILRDWMDQYPA